MFNIIKKSIKWIFIILGVLLFLLIGFFVLTEMKIIKSPKEEIPILKETKADIKEEWDETDHKGRIQPMIEIHYTFDGLNGIGYYQQQFQAKKGSHHNILTAQERIESQPEPTNLASYIKDRHPFDRWNEDGDTYNHTTLNGFSGSSFYMEDESHLYSNINFEKRKHEGPGNNALILKYKGPKHFLGDDKDYYLGRARLVNDDFQDSTNFHLHFNPVRKTLSIFKDKHNYDKVKEAENNKRTSHDW